MVFNYLLFNDKIRIFVLVTVLELEFFKHKHI